MNRLEEEREIRDIRGEIGRIGFNECRIGCQMGSVGCQEGRHNGRWGIVEQYRAMLGMRMVRVVG
jgi:hypothetical protein